jgi:predicted RNase H-like HicB family nuclease
MARYIALIDVKSGAYGVAFPDLPGCTATGKTMEAALANAVEALRDWAEVAEECHGKIPRARALEQLRGDADVRAALRDGARLASIPLVRDAGMGVKICGPRLMRKQNAASSPAPRLSNRLRAKR